MEALPQKLASNTATSPRLTRLIEQNDMIINIRGQEDETRKWKGVLWEERDLMKVKMKPFQNS